MSLPLVPTDSANEKQHRTLLATTLNELVKLYPREGSWTAVIRGSGTAGTYEIATQNCRYTRIGRRVWLDVWADLAAAITGGGTSNLNIVGLPFAKCANTFPVGQVLLSGVDWTAGGLLSLCFAASSSESSTLQVLHTNDNAATTTVPVSGVAANDRIFGSICYETDDP